MPVGLATGARSIDARDSMASTTVLPIVQTTVEIAHFMFVLGLSRNARYS